MTVAVSLLLWPVAAGLRHRPGLHGRRGRAWAPGSSSRRTACSRRIKRGGETKPMQLFHVSISYLALLSVAIVVDAIV